MDWRLRTLLALTLSALCRADDIECDASQHLVADCLWPCPPEKTCQNKDGPEPPCAPPMGPCTPKCVCTDGYAKNQYGGYCVTYEQCAQCGKNEYFSCDGAYSEDCTGSCSCTTGFARDANNTCVSTYTPPTGIASPPTVLPSPPASAPTTTEAPPKPVTCDNASRHEVPACVHICPREQTCQSRHWPHTTCPPPTLIDCQEKCICDAGYIRNRPGGDCVTTKQCDLCPGDNEYFQCDGEYEEDCVGHCDCYSGYVRDIDDKCIYVDPASPPKLPGPPAEDTDCDPANPSSAGLLDDQAGQPPWGIKSYSSGLLAALAGQPPWGTQGFLAAQAGQPPWGTKS